jgi:hypothetical protein
MLPSISRTTLLLMHIQPALFMCFAFLSCTSHNNHRFQSQPILLLLPIQHCSLYSVAPPLQCFFSSNLDSCTALQNAVPSSQGTHFIAFTKLSSRRILTHFVRTTQATECSFPFFAQCWADTSTRSFSATLATCPLVHGARVVVYSSPAANFSELSVCIEAGPDNDTALPLQTSCLPSRFCTHGSIDVEIASDVQLVQLHAPSAATAAASGAHHSAYIAIPESKAVADLLTAYWASRQHSSTGILLHGPTGCGKTACIKHVLSENKIQHEYFDCAALYAQDGSLFTEAVRSISRHSKRGATLDGSDNGAILVLDHLECMFPPLTSHTQVPILVICGFLPV